MVLIFLKLFIFFEKSEVNIFLVPIEYEIMEAGLGNFFFGEKMRCGLQKKNNKKNKKLGSPKTLKTCSTGP